MDGKPLSVDMANKVYDILVECAGARPNETERGDFVYAQNSRYIGEYRFMGALGFGGKFWRESSYSHMRVNTYIEIEAERPETIPMIVETNRRLLALPLDEVDNG